MGAYARRHDVELLDEVSNGFAQKSDILFDILEARLALRPVRLLLDPVDHALLLQLRIGPCALARPVGIVHDCIQLMC